MKNCNLNPNQNTSHILIDNFDLGDRTDKNEYLKAITMAKQMIDQNSKIFYWSQVMSNQKIERMTGDPTYEVSI